jgi:acetylornithine deacetylase/succinyl-diaminopimelate desuccinylase-like protein
MAAMMAMVLLKGTNARLDRDVIFLSEAGEEAGPGIEYVVADKPPPSASADFGEKTDTAGPLVLQ